MAEIHSSAVIDPRAELADDVIVGPYCVVEGPVRIGSGTRLKSHVVVEGDTVIGERNTIFPFTTIGVVPQDLKFHGEEVRTIIGDDNVIRESVSIHRGTAASGKTVVGDHNLLMANVHVAHDCVIGNHVIMANAATPAGHVTIQDYAIVGGLVGIHQFTTIGGHCYIGGGALITKDVLPFVVVFSYPSARVGAVNVVGMQRQGFTEEQIRQVKRAYRIIFRSGLSTANAVKRIREELELTDEVRTILEFTEGSERGLLYDSSNK